MNRTRVAVRPAVFLDSVKIYELGFKTLRAQYKPLYDTFTLEEVEHHLKVEARYCFVAVDNEGNVVGFVLAAKYFEGVPQYGHIEWVACVKDGYGLLLANYARKALVADDIVVSIYEICSENLKCINGIKKNGGILFDTKYYYSEFNCGIVNMCEPIQTVHLYAVSNKI